MSYYTINDFESLVFSGIQYKLPQNVLDIIENVSENLRNNMHLMDEYKNTNTNVSSSSSNNYKYVNDKKKPIKKDIYYKGKSTNTNYQKKEVTNSDWENLRNYKLTKVEQMEGITKSVSEIRVLINKISEKTYDTCKNKILELVDKFMEEYAATMNEIDNNPINELTASIFNIMIANKFNSKLNAELYSLLMSKYNEFVEIVNKYVCEFKHTIENIQNVDPDKDYDAYCVNVKKNDARKSSTIFLMNLFKLGKIESSQVLDIIEYFLDKTIEYIDMEDKTYIVEEITENIYLMVTPHIELLNSYEKWKLDLYTKIIHISNMKANQHPSLTNRVVFKYMDIIDSL